MHRNITTFILICIIFSLTVGTGEALQGTQVFLGGDEEIRLPLSMESQVTYEVSVNVRTNVPDAVAQLAIYFYDMDHEIMDHLTVSSQLGTEGKWQRLRLELQIPDQEVHSELVLTADRPGVYWWDALSVLRVETVDQSIREIWEKKFAEHGAFYTGLVIDARHLDVRRE